MSSHTGLQQKLVDYYKATNQNELARLQQNSKALSDSFHPIAILRYNPNGVSPSREIEVQFFKSPIGSLSANIYARFNDVVKRALLETLPEQNIIHAGYIYNKNVGDMSKSEKDAFIESLSRRYIYKIDDNIYLS